VNKTKIKKNKEYSKLWQKHELKWLSYKYLLFNKSVKKNIRQLLNYYIVKNMPKYFKSKLVNYCIISENPRWVFKKIYYSRQEFKKAVTKGTFMGIRKACW
jgi:ribosomal protein S14